MPMKKIIFVFGTIAGIIVSALMLISMSLMNYGMMSFENGELTGYASMIIALSMIYFGVKSFRDDHLSGVITFGKAFQVGILIALIASVIYASSWEAYLASGSGSQGFMDQYTTQYIERMKTEGASVAEIEEMKSEMSSMAEMYRNPVFRFGMTLVEILPVGLVITLLSAAILRRHESSSNISH